MKTLRILKRMFDGSEIEMKLFVSTAFATLIVYFPILNSIPPLYRDKIPNYFDIFMNCLAAFLVSFIISILVVVIIAGTKYLLTSFFKSFNCHKKELEEENSDEYKIQECKEFLRKHGVEEFK